MTLPVGGLLLILFVLWCCCVVSAAADALADAESAWVLLSEVLNGGFKCLTFFQF